jgi:hypothetical protein
VAENLPYLATPASIKTALEKIRAAATPDRVTVDFIVTKLDIKGGTGRAILPYLKKIGFVNTDGTPTELYRQFRNPTTGGAAVAKAIKIGYKSLQSVNEYFYDLKDSELLAAIVQLTGAEADGTVPKLTMATLKHLKAFAKFDEAHDTIPENAVTIPTPPAIPPTANDNGAPPPAREVGLNLAYTINLNLPATQDQAVFNAIFRSLKEHLLSYGK